jgi:DNA polymerase III epsilon subunit-like protein
MANGNYLAIFDFETGGVNPESCEVLSLGAVIVHPRKLEIVEGGEFYSVIKPEDRANVSPDALAHHKESIKLANIMYYPNCLCLLRKKEKFNG